MNNEPSQQPTLPITSTGPVNQGKIRVSNSLEQPQTSNSSSNANNPSAAYQDALTSVHSAGTWAIVLGLLNIVLTPFLEFLVYTRSGSNGKGEITLVLAALVVGLIVGGIFIGLGLKLKQATIDTFCKADRVLLWLAVIIGIVMILSLIATGHGVGLLNIFAALKVAQARGKIKKLGKE